MMIFGLGNPGLRYRATRHNVGYIFLDRFAQQYKKRFHSQRGYRIARIVINDETVRLIKPRCWMNLSGIAVSKILHGHDEDFLVVVDDVNLPLGRTRLRSKGSDGGHLGLRSIVSELNTEDFWRLRIGIGLPHEDYACYVLNSFRRDEKRTLHDVIKEAIKGVKLLIRGDFTSAQNYINSVDLTDAYGNNRESG